MSESKCIYYLKGGHCRDGKNCPHRIKENGGNKCKLYGRCGNINSSSEKRPVAFRRTSVQEI